MIKIAIFATLVVAALAAPQQRPQDVTVVQDNRENDGAGNFRWNYELSDGTRADQSGYIKNPGAPQDETIQAFQGSYGHYSPEGQYYSVSYTADENGFVPQGDHLPTPPPIPEAIQKALAIIYANAGQQVQRAQRESNGQNRQQPYRPQPPRRF